MYINRFFNWRDVLVFDNWLFKFENLFHTTGSEYFKVLIPYAVDLIMCTKNPSLEAVQVI